MGGWFSAQKGDAAPPTTPSPAKLAGTDAAQLSSQLVTRLQGARHAPAARALPRAAGCRRTPCAGPPTIWGLGAFPAFPCAALKGAGLVPVRKATPLPAAWAGLGRDDAVYTLPHLTSPYLTSPHLTSPPLNSPNPTSPHLIFPHLPSPHLTVPHPTSPHLTYS